MVDYRHLARGLRTVAVTTPTPFTDGGDAVDHEALAANLHAVDEAGARVVIPCGNTGEYDALTTEECVAVVETHAETLGDDVLVVGGAGGSAKTVASLARRYREAGADAVMIMHPPHTYVHERGLVRYYREIAAATDLGVVLYRRGPELTPAAIGELSTIDNVVAVKFATADVAEFADVVATAPGDVTWLNGLAERYALPFAAAGAEGYTTGIGNFVPDETLALFDAIEAGEWDRARRIADILRPYETLRQEPGADNSLAAANNVPAVKYGMELAGHAGGPVRSPLVELPPDDAERAERYFERIRQSDVA